MRHYHDQVYALALREPGTQHQLILISNANRITPERYTPTELAEALLRRWAIENYLKVMKARHGLDQILGHELFEPGDEDWMVPNPAHVRLKRRLAAVEILLQNARSKAAALKDRFEGLKRKSTLRAPETPVYRRAAEALLQSLNDLKPEALDGSGRLVRFELEKS